VGLERGAVNGTPFWVNLKCFNSGQFDVLCLG
jgi:hypothetical protein